MIVLVSVIAVVRNVDVIKMWCFSGDSQAPAAADASADAKCHRAAVRKTQTNPQNQYDVIELDQRNSYANATEIAAASRRY